MFGSRRGDPLVLSMMVQANLKRKTRSLGPFEVLVRHFLDRLFSSEALGSSEEAGVRIAQIACAVALPGMVFALYLFPIYHLPQGKPPFWFQCSNHFFYVAYAFVTMGLFAVLQWDLLFPDPLDAMILASMPISGRRLLAARSCALALFFSVLLLGTSFLGILAFPAGIDLPGVGFHLFWAHTIAVLTSGFFGICLFLALRGLLLCLCSRQWAQRLSAAVQMFCMLALFATLLSIPFCDHFLQAIFESGSLGLFWFPPFWFWGCMSGYSKARMPRRSSANSAIQLCGRPPSQPPWSSPPIPSRIDAAWHRYWKAARPGCIRHSADRRQS